MSDIALFPVPKRDYAGGPEFREFLASDAELGPIGRPLTLVTGLTKRSESGIEAAFEMAGLRVVERLGAVLHIRAKGSGGIESYATLEKDGVLVFYTNYRKVDDLPSLTRFLDSDPESVPVRFRSSVIQNTLNRLMEEFPRVRVTDFTAKSGREVASSGKVRPGKERTISYWGEDGGEVLNELRYQYGVQPTRLVVEIPGVAKIGIDERGILTHSRGRRSLVLQTLGTAINEANRNLIAFEKVNFEVFSMKTKTTTFELPRAIPFVVRLHSKLTVEKAQRFFDVLERNDYSKLDYLAQDGSLFLSANVVAPDGSRVRVRANEDEIRLLPGNEPGFRTYMGLYDLIMTHVDADAELVP
jgi:hypothetical protein